MDLALPRFPHKITMGLRKSFNFFRELMDVVSCVLELHIFDHRLVIINRIQLARELICIRDLEFFLVWFHDDARGDWNDD